MVKPGGDSPVKAATVSSHSTQPPGPSEWRFVSTSRPRMKRAGTPHPGKVGGNTKRNALISMTEIGRVRKKIVFELDELAVGFNGGTNALAGEGKVSSPTDVRKGGRWIRKARPGPFEASIGASDVVPGVLPLLAGDLRFSMGRKEVSAWNQPDAAAGTGLTGVAGTRPEAERPEEKSAVALVESRSMHVEMVAASLAAMDEDTLQNEEGANMLSESTNLAAPFPEMSSCVLASETCDSSHGESNFEFESIAGTSSLAGEANVGGEAETDGKPPAPETSPENSPEQDLVQHENVRTQTDKPAFEEGSVAAHSGMPPVLESSPELTADQPGQDSTHPDEPTFGEYGNPSAGLESGGAAKPDPVTLDDDHDKEMGTAGSCEGVPSLTFSNEETKSLADKIGHAIIGKFSHTIPTSKQIQKALSNIQFIDGFKWKFVNAKHILIQFRDARDYGRMLNGPNGAPVWYIEHHPMRVFKWTPDFDTFFESPIAVVWCKVIGLPIHLYDQSALIAIGKLLGKPIQVDRATLDQNRLTFARICVEIDISSPPPEEIILNILGKDNRYKVVWDRIPLFCVECKHVGHVKETCFTLGKKAEQPTKEPNRPSQNRQPNPVPKSYRREWRPKKPSSNTHTSKSGREPTSKEETETGSSKEKRGVHVTSKLKTSMGVQAQVDEDGFQLVTKRRKGKSPYPIHQVQGGAHKASFLEKLLKGSNVTTVSLDKPNAEVNDPGGSSAILTL